MEFCSQSKYTAGGCDFCFIFPTFSNKKPFERESQTLTKYNLNLPYLCSLIRGGYIVYSEFQFRLYFFFSPS